jgi:hypothetical protein
MQRQVSIKLSNTKYENIFVILEFWYAERKKKAEKLS